MSDHTPSRTAEILLVEDSAADARLTLEALKQGKLTNSVHHVKDGEEAMQFLRRETPFSNMPRPDLVLLDLNMPRKNGLEVLEEIRADDDLKRMPVLILTTSENDDDVQRAYDLNVNCYITKPVELDQFLTIVKQIDTFWLDVATLPQP